MVYTVLWQTVWHAQAHMSRNVLTSHCFCCREQIRGKEALSRVPEEFVPQLPEAANPPTLLLPLLAVAEELTEVKSPGPLDHMKMPDAPGMLKFAEGVLPEQWLDFLQRAWPKLLLWYAWLERTQAGPQQGTFRCVRYAGGVALLACRVCWRGMQAQALCACARSKDQGCRGVSVLLQALAAGQGSAFTAFALSEIAGCLARMQSLACWTQCV